MDLRPYQSRIISETRALMKQGVRSILITSPCGSGKTCLTAFMVKTAAEKRMVSWFLNHRRELTLQSSETFTAVGVPHGIVSAGFIQENNKLVQICSVQSLTRRMDRLRSPSLIIWDECHHLGAKSWENIYRRYPNAFHIGLTATPARTDGTGLGKFFQKIVYGPSIQELTEQGYLAPYKLYAPSTVNLSGVHTRMGDFVTSELVDIVDKPTVTGCAVNEYKKRALGKRAIVFCVSIEHSKHVAQAFSNSGVPAEHVDGELPSEDRDAALSRFKSGQTLVLSNCELFGEGLDIPAVETAILLRPTASLGLFVQQTGRALRPSPGKSHAIILDHAGNTERHGLPDEPREWSLDGIPKSKSTETGPRCKVCPQCFAAQVPGLPRCKFCGCVFEVKGREIDFVEGDLVEIDPAMVRRQRLKEQGSAQTIEELIEVGRKRGYQRPHLWAKHVFAARQAKKVRGQ